MSFFALAAYVTVETCCTPADALLTAEPLDEPARACADDCACCV